MADRAPALFNFDFDFETGTASCRPCHTTEHDVLTYDEAGHLHAAAQQHCRPPSSTPRAKALPFRRPTSPGGQ